MAQEYNAILPGGSTNILQDNIDSRKNEEALRSGFSGSAFPTSPAPVAGQRCYREDLKKEYIFNGESWVEVASSGAIAQEVTLARGTHTELQDRLGVSMNPDGTLKTPATANVDEFKVSGFEPTYVSTNSFSVPGDMRAIFTENRRLKVTQGVETIYPAVVSASYDDVSDKTTIVIDNITITNEIATVDYSLVRVGLPANLDAGTLNGKSDTAFQEIAEKDQPGGYVGLDNNGALNSKIRATSISDFNDVYVGGHYYWGSNTINAPVPGAGGTMLVIDRGTSNSGVYQQATSWHGELYVRALTKGTWEEWRRIDATTWGSISGTLSDQTDLQAALNGKANTSHSHNWGSITGTLSAQTDLQTALNGKANTSHSHNWGSITGTLSAQTDLQTALNGKANTSHSHNYAPIPTSSNLPVGAWCLCYNNATSDIANGGTVAGSNLKIFGLTLITSTGSSPGIIEGGSLPGTWKNITGTTVGGYHEKTSEGVTTRTRHCGLFIRTA